MGRKHGVFLYNDRDIRLYARPVGAFCRLSFCHSCGFRHTSDVAMREHRMTHDTRRMERKPLLPTPRPLTPPPTTLKEEVIVIPDDGAVKEEPTEGDDKTEDQRVVVAKTPKVEFKIDIDAAWSCSDDAYDDPDREAHAVCPFMVYLQGDILPARAGEPFVRRRVLLERTPEPGVYGLERDVTGPVMKVDVVYHHQHPDKVMFPPRLSAWNGMRMGQQVVLMTARNHPATATRVAYFEKMPDEGLYYLSKPDDDGYTTRVFITGAAVFNQ